MLFCFSTPSPSTNQTVRFMDFVYLSQVVQSICIQAEAEHYRRLLSEEGVFTRGTLYWQLVCGKTEVQAVAGPSLKSVADNLWASPSLVPRPLKPGNEEARASWQCMCGSLAHALSF